MHSFSFIIAAYNSSEYITKTIETIINTKYDPNKYEIIIVNDGSTDNTLEVINKLANQYSNIKVYSKPNGNWGSVMNYVRENKLLNNEYTVVLDSDDFLSCSFFKYANKTLNNADMLLMGLFVQGKIFKYYASPYYWIFKRSVPLENRFTPAFVPFSIVVKTELFYQAPTLVEKVSYQDFYLFFALLQKAKDVRFTWKSAGLYNKYRPGNTMSATWSNKRFEDEKILHKKMQEIDLSETLALRILMSGYTKKAKQENYRISMGKRPRALWLPKPFRFLFDIMYKFHLYKFIKIEK